MLPQVTAPTAALAELDIVYMGSLAFFKQRKQFMLRTVEAAHSGIRFSPND
jgi:hypothetical protein